MDALKSPGEIQARSFEIIEGVLKGMEFPGAQKSVIKRVIHATADPGYAKDMLFHSKAVEAGLNAIRGGGNIISDANMVKAGINKKTVSKFGGRVFCFINDRDVVRRSSKSGVTCAALAIQKARNLMNGGIAAIGNAPTALSELCNLVSAGKAHPALIVGVPVGFVGAKEAKRKLRTVKTPYITNKSRKGGSSAAAAIVNALLAMAEKRGQRFLSRGGACPPSRGGACPLPHGRP